MTNLTARSESRAFHFTTGGNDDNDGSTYNLAFFDPAVAVNSCNALSPPPALFQQATVVNIGAGGFTTQLQNLDSIQFLAGGTSLNNATDAFTVSLGSNTNFDITTVTNSTAGGVAVLCDGKSRSGLDYKFISAFGSGSTASLKLTGACDQVFTNGGQLTASQDGIGLLDESSGSNVVLHRANIITLDGNNSIGVKIGEATASKVFTLGSIVESGSFSGTTGIQFAAGRVSGTCTDVTADTALDVLAGCDAHYNGITVIGDIKIAATGDFTCNVTEHSSGSVINSGLLNGRIGPVLYGTWEIATGEFLSSTIVEGKVKDGSFDDYGRLTIDGAVDTIDEIRVSYYQDTTTSRTVDFQLIDADTLTVYLSGTSPAQTTKDTFYFDVSVASPGFPASTVNLIMQLKASGNKIEVGNVNVYFTRN